MQKIDNVYFVYSPPTQSKQTKNKIMYVIKKGGYYVANPGSKNSYTNKIETARKFSTKEQAEKEKCGNETVVKSH